MNVSITNDNSCRKTTAVIYGDLDHHTAKYIRSEIDKAISDNNTKKLIIDFSNVTFMDSSGIGLVMGRYRILNELSGEVIISNPPNYIRKVMRLSGLNKLCRIVYGEHTDKPEQDKTTLTEENTHENDDSKRA